MCGEQLIMISSFLTIPGSSPRVRGTVEADLSALRGEGIIPACAGNRPDREPSGFLGRDHPRVCGEQMIVRNGSNLPMGSSPRVRGTVLGDSAKFESEGIIPACAGNR